LSQSPSLVSCGLVVKHGQYSPSGSTIAKQLSIPVISDSSTQDLYRGIRQQLAALLGGVDTKDLNTMSLGLGHSMSRFKLKFSTDKVDTMVIQAIALLDDLDKEINIYSMRVKEWYGWHFPEMGKIIVDNLAYAKVVKAMGTSLQCYSDANADNQVCEPTLLPPLSR
jgi:nucleolar protein 58